MQNIIKILFLIALIFLLSFFYYQNQKSKSTINILTKENLELKKSEKTDLVNKIKILKDENRLLKDQIFQLEKEQFL